MEQLDPKHVFKAGDGLAHRRLGQTHAVGRLREIVGAGRGNKNSDSPKRIRLF
ncbi:hypothetical protein D3C85_1908560 [compost metagenome]